MFIYMKLRQKIMY